MTQRDDKDEREDEAEEEADETEADSSDAAPAAEAKTEKPERSKAARAASKARREARAASRDEARPAARPAASSSSSSRALMIGVVALAAGLAAGWFAHDAQAKSKLKATDSAPAAAGSSGPCNAWSQKICGSSGEQSATCAQAKGATELLTPSTCESALATVPATLAKVKAARASCNNLVTKLCGDLPKGSSTCKMVTERTESFPPDRCKEMLEHYDEVIGQLKQIDAQGGPEGQGGPPGGGPPGMPPGAMPPGMPPGAMPQGAPH